MQYNIAYLIDNDQKTLRCDSENSKAEARDDICFMNGDVSRLLSGLSARQ